MNKETCIILILSFYFLLSCKPQNKEIEKLKSYKHDSINIIYYKYGRDKHQERIKIHKIKSDNFTQNVYYYRNLHDTNDTITLNERGVFLNNYRLEYLSEKEYLLNNKNTRLKKFYVNQVYSSSHFYLNDDNNIVLSRIISSNIIVEYFNPTDPPDIHKTIINDTVFFREW